MPELAPPSRPTHLTVFRVLLGLSLILSIILIGKELAPHLPHLEKWVLAQGLMAPVYYILLVCVLTLLCVPIDIMLIAAGVMFPLGEGFAYVAIALCLSQSLIFWFSRLLLYHYVQQWVERKPKLLRINQALNEQGIKLLLLIRLAPVPASPVSYLMGASAMGYGRFCLGTLGLLPVAFVSQYTGYAAAHATRIASHPERFLSLHSLLLYGGLALLILVVALLGHVAHKLLYNVEDSP